MSLEDDSWNHTRNIRQQNPKKAKIDDEKKMGNLQTEPKNDEKKERRMLRKISEQFVKTDGSKVVKIESFAQKKRVVIKKGSPPPLQVLLSHTGFPPFSPFF